MKSYGGAGRVLEGGQGSLLVMDDLLEGVPAQC